MLTTDTSIPARDTVLPASGASAQLGPDTGHIVCVCMDALSFVLHLESVWKLTLNQQSWPGVRVYPTAYADTAGKTLERWWRAGLLPFAVRFGYKSPPELRQPSVPGRSPVTRTRSPQVHNEGTESSAESLFEETWPLVTSTLTC